MEVQKLMEGKKLTIYDKEKDYKEKKIVYGHEKKIYRDNSEGESAAELIKRAFDRCVVENIPIFISAAVANDENETRYEYMYNGTGHTGINLKDDKFIDFLLVANGLKARRPGTLLDFEGKEVEEYLNYEGPGELNVKNNKTLSSGPDNIDDVGTI